MPKKTEPDDEQKSERFNMFMSPSEMKAIDDWAWQNKIRSKSEAVRRLCQIGLLVGAELEGLADAAVEASDAMTELDDEAFGVWAAITSPVYKTETLRREAMIEEFGTLLSQIAKVNVGIDALSNILVGLFAASAGMSRLDVEEGRKHSEKVLLQMSESLEKLRDSRKKIEEHRKGMSEFGFRSSDSKGGADE